MIVNIHEAKTNFSRLVELALHGDEVIIARNGKALLRLTPLAHAGNPKRSGLSRGKVQVSDDFDAPLPEEIIAEFEK
jgi:prevent-host-death family protein